MEELDVSIHSFEEIPGKFILINNVQYEIKEFYDEGGTAFVYPLKNHKSKLILFVMKLYKYLPGSREYADIKQWMEGGQGERNFLREKSKMGPREELYYVKGGGIMRFQKSLTAFNDVEHFDELMTKATEFFKNNRFYEAIILLDQILEQNPHHTLALAKSAWCHSQIGDVKSIQLIEEALQIEPNDSNVYKNYASIALNFGMYDLGIRVLKKALRRYEWDYLNFEYLTELALEYDYIDLSDQLLTEVLEKINGTARFNNFKENFKKELKLSKIRKKKYVVILSKINYEQQNNNWQYALELCDQAMTISKDHVIAEINHVICKYHLGEYDEIAELSARLIYEQPRWLHSTSLIISILSNLKLHNYDVAMDRFDLLDEICPEPFDYPLIPKAVVAAQGNDQNMILTSSGVKEIINYIHVLIEYNEDSHRLKQLERLNEIYTYIEVQLQGNHHKH